RNRLKSEFRRGKREARPRAQRRKAGLSSEGELPQDRFRQIRPAGMRPGHGYKFPRFAPCRHIPAFIFPATRPSCADLLQCCGMPESSAPWSPCSTLVLDGRLHPRKRLQNFPSEAIVAGRPLLQSISQSIPSRLRWLAHLVRLRTLNRFHSEAKAVAQVVGA